MRRTEWTAFLNFVTEAKIYVKLVIHDSLVLRTKNSSRIVCG